MTCEDFAAIARDFVRGEWMSVPARTEAEAHWEGCPLCRQRAGSERGLERVLAAYREDCRGEGAPAAVQVAVLAAFDQRFPQRRTPRWVWAIPVAAAILVAALLFRPAPPAPLLRAREAPLRAAPAPLAEAAGEVSEGTGRAAPPVAAGRQWRPAVVPERVTQFLPVRYGRPLEPGEPFHLLRIQLPRSELVRLGIPLTPDGPGAVKADVLVGEDGLAKAIRFVY